MIKQFRDEFAWLSNMTPCVMTYKGIEYATSEHAYMSAKSDDMVWKSRCADKQVPAKVIKRESKDIILVDNWDKLKLFVMTEVINIKFSLEPFRTQLLSTGDLLIEEGNTWNDLFWGVDKYTRKGENHLGNILMEKRKKMENKNTINFDKFIELSEQLDIRIGEIIDAELIPKSYGMKLTVNFGEDESKTAFTNLGKTHTPLQVIGVRCPFVMNLEPSVIKGVTSEVMIMVGEYDFELEVNPIEYVRGAKLM
tara:strand:- start:33680 stop:34435 length:756 start_codon:yes stop_codon:yes gene_type:complete